jgi:hypothetical protein
LSHNKTKSLLLKGERVSDVGGGRQQKIQTETCRDNKTNLVRKKKTKQTKEAPISKRKKNRCIAYKSMTTRLQQVNDKSITTQSSCEKRKQIKLRSSRGNRSGSSFRLRSHHWK